jgi:1,4-dihydroxy-2-naphthoyl-CoA hydrolase
VSIWHAPIDLDAVTAACAGSMPGFLGITFVAAGDDWLRARMPVDQRTRQPYGRLHGGASVALAETVASVAAMATLDPAMSAAVGMEINANHLRPVGDGFVHATATCEARGRTSQVWTIRIEDERGRLVCLARMTAAVIAAVRGEVG